ncbi:GNAT family N-acetyltransferase [Glaciibacter psychrotolerans]|uniref:RimJ/RimL family protein N-acetyltransferase n=1 Tax=Glaciibacter psychrotolerans TaxID=670054 RepID=A0A7Z0EGA0_9MICO|nr:RimJ/RimL family protein N-acetyltransferase [Leifsonia psychrotolerans]
MTTPAGLTTLPFDAYPLRTDRLMLRPLTDADVDDVFAYQSDAEVVRYLPWPVRDLDESREHTLTRAGFTRLENDRDALILAVELHGEHGDGDGRSDEHQTDERQTDESQNDAGVNDGVRGPVIGDLTVVLESGELAQIEIGWVFHPDYQRKGYATEAARALLELAFAHIGAHRVLARLDPHNTASVALCQRLGMRQEAYFRESEILKGEWGDLAIYALLRSEWEAVR